MKSVEMIRTCVVMCFGFILSGCGESVEYPATAVVEGKVTLDGQAVDGATITLTPTATEGKTYGARAISGPDGTFKVMTNFSADQDVSGAVPGKYQVSVTKYEQAASGPGSHEAMSSDPAANRSQYEQYARGGPGPGAGHGAQGSAGGALPPGMAAPKNLLPAKYDTPAKSGLEIEVKAGQTNQLPLDLTSG